MQDLHGRLNFRQSINELHGQAFEKTTMIIDGVFMIETAHLVCIAAISGVAPRILANRIMLNPTDPVPSTATDMPIVTPVDAT